MTRRRPGARLAAWSAALAAALLLHAAAFLWLGPRFEPRGRSAPGERGAGVRLALVSAPAPAPARRSAAAEAAPRATPEHRSPPEPAPAATPTPAPGPSPDPPPAKDLAALAPSAPSPPPAETALPQTAPDASGAPTARAREERAPEPDARAAAAESGSGGAPGAGEDARQRYEDALSIHVQGCLRYPKRAARRRIRGEVDLTLRIASDGALDGAALERSSGEILLDRDAVETVRRCAPYPPPPAEAGGAGAFALRIGYDPP